MTQSPVISTVLNNVRDTFPSRRGKGSLRERQRERERERERERDLEHAGGRRVRRAQRATLSSKTVGAGVRVHARGNQASGCNAVTGSR